MFNIYRLTQLGIMWIGYTYF